MQDEHLDHDPQPDSQATPHGPPPTPPGASGTPTERSTWPIIVGVIVLVFGAFGLLGNLFGAVSPYFVEGLMSTIGGEVGGEAQESIRATMEVTRAWRSWSVGIGLLNALVSALLLVGGILLLMRRASSASLLKLWAVVRVVMVIVTAYIGLRVQQATFAAMRESMGAEMEQVPEALIGGAAMFGMAFSVVFGWALPVFVLIWFARRAIQDEVAGWQ